MCLMVRTGRMFGVTVDEGSGQAGPTKECESKWDWREDEASSQKRGFPLFSKKGRQKQKGREEKS